MIAKVAPIRRMPRSTEPYDYLIPEGLTLNVGSFVEVPMRGKPIMGLVVEIVATSEFKRLSTVTRVLDTPPFSSSDVEFYTKLARRTYQSISSILHASIPDAPKRKTTSSQHKIEASPLGIDKSQITSLKQIVGELQEATSSRVAVPSDSFSIAVILGLLKTTTEPILVICPDISLVQAAASSCISLVDQITIYGGNMNKTQAYEGWIAIRTGSSRLVVATRVGALVPPSANTRIVVLACGEDDHFQTDQNPHYDVRWCVNEVAALNGNKATFMGTMPRVEDGELTHDLWEKPEVEIVNINETKRTSDSYWLSPPTIELIKNADTRSRPLIIYFNRKYSEQNRTSNLDIAHEIRELLGSPPPLKGELEGVIQQIHVIQANDPMPTSGIAIITNTLLYQMTYTGRPIAGLVILNAEQPFVMRGFRSLEKAVRTLRRLSSWANSVNAPVIIQTKNPEIVRDALRSTTAIFEKELSMRKMLKYPPFGNVHVLRAKEELEIVESFKAQHEDAHGGSNEIVVKLATNKIVNEWMSYPQTCDIIVNPDQSP